MIERSRDGFAFLLMLGAILIALALFNVPIPVQGHMVSERAEGSGAKPLVLTAMPVGAR